MLAALAIGAVATFTGEARACLPLPDGDALVGTGGGLVRVDEKGAPRGVWTASDGLPGTRIDAVTADGARVWIATDGGVAEVTPDDDGGVTITRAIATRPARDVVRFGGAVYVATWDGGVVKVGAHGATAMTMKGGAKAARGRVASLAIAGGALYAGTEAGLYRLGGARFDKVAVDGIAGVTALAGDDARLWIGTRGGLFVREDDRVRAIGGGEVRRLAVVDHAVVIAGADGLATVDRGRVVALAGAPKLGVAEALGASGGARCAGGLDGLWLRADDAAPWLHAEAAAGPPSNDLSALALDRASGRLYVGTFDHGVAVREGGAWRALGGEPGAIDPRVNAILVEPRGDAAARLWIGTAEGLFVVDGATTRRIGKRDGLPGRNVLALARTSDGRIVAGTSQGAAFVDGARPERVGPHTPGVDVGNVWAIAEAPAGTLWLGTTTGLYRGAARAWTSKDDGGDGWTRLSVASGALADDWVTALLPRGGTIYAGTYHGGVAAIDTATGKASPLGGGWINPGGLAWDGDRLAAATMDGLVESDGAHPIWTAITGLPGKDTTALVRADDGTRWIATRRGLATAR